jgi:hypothetical protein
MNIDSAAAARPPQRDGFITPWQADVLDSLQAQVGVRQTPRPPQRATALTKWQAEVLASLKALENKPPPAVVPQIRVTRPNIDDRLVEVWDGSSWHVVSYDSDWRDIKTLITGRESTLVGRALIRRVDDQVWMNLAIGDSELGSSRETFLWNIPHGFDNDYNFYATGNLDADDTPPIHFRVGAGFMQYGGVRSLNNLHDALLTWPTSAAIPTSLPGGPGRSDKRTDDLTTRSPTNG